MRGEKQEDIVGIPMDILLIIFGTLHVQARTDRLLKKNSIIKRNQFYSFICP
jgi:hypothetical protein